MKILLLIVALMPCTLMAQLVRIDFSVVDYDGAPLPGVDIKYYTDGKVIGPYRKAPRRKLSCRTGNDGKASEHFFCWDGLVDCYFKKDGYYPERVRDVRFGANYDRRTEKTTFATNQQSVVVRMKPIRHPEKMICRHVDKGELKYPSNKGTWGFDLQIGDWVAPWGKGQIPDFVVNYEWMDNEEEASAKGCVEFVGRDSGAYVRKKDTCLQFPIEYTANTNESFVSSFTFCSRREKKTGKYSEDRILSADEYMVIRSRVKTDESGNIVEANYSHVQGPFNFGRYFTIKHIYCNPRVNDVNLEYDKEQ